MTQMPSAVVAALLQRPAARDAEVRSSRIRRGDIRFARGLPGEVLEPRLVLVLSVDSQLDFANVLLVHTASEMSCDVDVVVPATDSGAPYEVVIETDLRGVIWTIQLGSSVGHVGEDFLRLLGRETPSPDLRARPETERGTQLAGPADPRWGFKGDEGAALGALARDCTDALLDEEAWQVEAALLRPELLDLAADPTALVSDLMHWLRTRTLELSTTDVEVLLELGALDTGVWEAFGGLGLDISTAVQSLVEAAATAVTASPGRADQSVAWRLVTATHIEVRARGSQPKSIRYLGHKELVRA